MISNEFKLLEGDEQKIAVAALQKEQAKFLAKPLEITQQEIIDRGLFRKKRLRLIVQNDFKLIWVRKGLGFFHSPNMFPLRRGQKVLKAREPVYASFFNQSAYMMVAHKPYHYSNLARWMTRIFTLNRLNKGPAMQVFRVPEPVFRRSLNVLFKMT